ncbi:MAG TPA: metal-dependent phosphohydrolase [Synechococcales cyanobacterium M55_K2018_004]|nr:metal-dependent phosphohydrolase [Synechococcales cyanobacterium M55_K2018_004]
MLQGSILQELRDAHQPGNPDGKRPLNFGVYFKNTLVALCHALEDAILMHDYQPLMITAFQRGKWYLQEADRYGEIAERAPQVVILAAADTGFADHPTSQRANVALVSLEEDDPVAQEWHLIILSPTYTAMVLCQELSEDDYGASGCPTHDLERKFYGLWTFEPNLVLETAKLAIAHIAAYNPQLAAKLTDHHQEIAAQIQRLDTPYSAPTVADLGEIVSRVVAYLENGPQGLESDRSSNSLAASPSPLSNNLISNELQAFLRIAQLIDQTDLSNPMAAAEVATLAESLGQLLDLPAWQLHRLRLSGLLHRIAFLQDAATPLHPSARPSSPTAVPLSCPLIPGVQVLRTMQRLKAIATILTHQTERWDGQGTPAGLAGDEIPLESRILGLVACFQQRLAAHRSRLQATPDLPLTPAATPAAAYAAALAECQAEQGDRWDPKLVEALSLLVNGLQQGLSLSVTPPKIAAGLWLLDSHSDEDLINWGASSEHRSLSTASGNSGTYES